MATQSDPVLKITPASQASLLSFTTKIVEHHKQNSLELRNKMDIIDRAYTRYKASTREGSSGVDEQAAEEACDVFNTKDKVTPPIVVSQVDSYVGYLADVFLSGYPLFPVLSTPATKKWAEQLEVLMDDHALLGAYPRQLLLFLREAVKYNYAGIELDWDTVERYSTITDFLPESANGRKLERSSKYFNRLRRLDPRNIIRDCTVLPCDVAEHGDFAGYVEMMSMTRMKRWLIKEQKKNKCFNIEKAMSTQVSTNLESTTFTALPQVSDYVTNDGYKAGSGGVDWDAYAEGNTVKKRKTPSYGAMYEKVVIYARVIPLDHGIAAPQPNTPQIWKLVVINGKVIVCAHRVISAYDMLPILIGQPLEDGFGEQTQSIAEGEIPFQQAAETLFNIRFSAARRAVSDRALYNSNVLTPAQVNSKAAAAKIAVNINPLNTNQTLDSVYRPIPFDMRGTETAIGDAQTIVAFSKELHGLNAARSGQFQRGNKSVKEWDDVMGGSENRLRLPALTLEHQVFAPLKSMMALNILQYGEDAEIVSQKSGDVVSINIQELRERAMSFRVADGYTPKSKMASTDMLTQGMQIIANSPILQQAYGSHLPGMFAHLMSLGGVRGLDEYNPQAQAPASAATTNLQQAAIQQPITPITPEVP
jgi:hypothetical protein